MPSALLVQLPIPQLNYGRQAGNVPLAAALLKQAWGDRTEILPESRATYIGDEALIDLIIQARADVVGFTVYCWNLARTLYFAERLKKAYAPRIVLGGPEITPDNEAVKSPDVDFLVFGDGEAVFRELMTNKGLWELGSASMPSDEFFIHGRSPYQDGLLEPEIENVVLLETQRGCPHRCAYCYYPKDRSSIGRKREEVLLESAGWAVENGFPEIYLLDPSLDSRPNLKGLLKKLAAINKNGDSSFISEIRAEPIDDVLADRFVEAGFSWFEIGLQTINQPALDIMKRKVNLDSFLAGAQKLKEREIIPRVDLMVGLPGDDLDGFVRSASYVAENDLADDPQVFPLSILPGTEFRRRAIELGLTYHQTPPYVVRETPAFSEDQLLLAFDYAEYRFDLSLHPWPDPDIAWRQDFGEPKDVWVRIGERRYLWKLIVDRDRPLEEIRALAARVTNPYQAIVPGGKTDISLVKKVIETMTSANPHTSLEVVLIEPSSRPSPGELLESVRIHRPHFLDVEFRFMFPTPGNRAVMFTLVTNDNMKWHQGGMERQVYWWKEPTLPTGENMDELEAWDGILIDSGLSPEKIGDWQREYGPGALDSLPPIGFANLSLQEKWLKRIKDDEYYFGARRGAAG